MEYAPPVKWGSVLFVHESRLLWSRVLKICARLSLVTQEITGLIEEESAPLTRTGARFWFGMATEVMIWYVRKKLLVI